jgi:signal transduction histidine kinase
MLTLTNLIFNQQECRVATIRDVTEVKRLAKIEADNKLLHMLTSSVTHEMLTPLKCMVSFSKTVLRALADSPKKYEAKLIMTTSKLLLS